MDVVDIADKDVLRAYFAVAPALHIYELGDLDDLFWPRTRWYGLGDRDPRAVALLYAAEVPVLLALGDPDPLSELLTAIRDRLPARLYAHLSPGLSDALAPRYAREAHHDSLKMILADRAPLARIDTSRVVPLGRGDRAELEAFYARCYPGNWFDARMLDTGQYFAIRDGELVAAGGVHVYSPVERVAALGNIAVAPERRGLGLATQVVARTCRSLLDHVDHVGLNVRADNRAAIGCYERLGFASIARYEETLFTSR